MIPDHELAAIRANNFAFHVAHPPSSFNHSRSPKGAYDELPRNMRRPTPHPFSAHIEGALYVWTNPKLTKNVSFKDIAQDINPWNFRAKKETLANRVKRLCQGKLAQDASIDNLVYLLDVLEEQAPRWNSPRNNGKDYGRQEESRQNPDLVAAARDKNKIAQDPPVSEAQRRAMYAAREGESTLGIPKKVGEEFVGKSKDCIGRARDFLHKAKDDEGGWQGEKDTEGKNMRTGKDFMRGRARDEDPYTEGEMQGGTGEPYGGEKDPAETALLQPSEAHQEDFDPTSSEQMEQLGALVDYLERSYGSGIVDKLQNFIAEANGSQAPNPAAEDEPSAFPGRPRPGGRVDPETDLNDHMFAGRSGVGTAHDGRTVRLDSTGYPVTPREGGRGGFSIGASDETTYDPVQRRLERIAQDHGLNQIDVGRVGRLARFVKRRTALPVPSQDFTGQGRVDAMVNRLAMDAARMTGAPRNRGLAMDSRSAPADDFLSCYPGAARIGTGFSRGGFSG
jgi:hypothetical protein